MDVKSAFSDDEWNIVAGLPSWVVAAAIKVEPSSGLGEVSELVNGLRILTETASLFGDESLVGQVFADYRRDGYGEAEILRLTEEWSPEYEAATVDRCRRVAALLDGRIEPMAAAEYKSWIASATRSVIESVTTGGFLGFGGERVTDSEQSYLDRVREALGLPIEPPAGEAKPREEPAEE
jgi:hypothetical protein